jgi:hypothetical protein
MLTREDVERITENVLKRLSIQVDSGNFYDPNIRKVILRLDNDVISETHFDVVQKKEYKD